MNDSLLRNKALRTLWWSLFWRYFLYTQIFFILFSWAVGVLNINAMIHDHTIFMDTVQAIVEGFAMAIALIQAIKIHFPSLLSSEGNLCKGD